MPVFSIRGTFSIRRKGLTTNQPSFFVSQSSPWDASLSVGLVLPGFAGERWRTPGRDSGSAAAYRGAENNGAQRGGPWQHENSRVST